ncbi:Peptidase M24A methionine aminopeptidase subfamily 1 [Trinorchestia longiramus]|nr:Peptidase M24A methionine aminopeptidase subfamily 1 [Trinorchestia longiramus]
MASISYSKIFSGLRLLTSHPVRHFGKVKSFLCRDTYGTYDIIKAPGHVSASGNIPPHIKTPSHWPHGRPQPSPTEIEIKNEAQIEGVRQASAIAREVLNEIGKTVEVGITTEELDKIAHHFIIGKDSFPSPLQYRSFPKSICTSINNVVCHGIPDDRPLQRGDIISVDVTVYHGGYHGDCCETWCLEGTDEQGQHLVHHAREARDKAIALCGPGVCLGRIGEACEYVARAAGLSIVEVFIGHGIGSYFHGPPDIYHFANDDYTVMKPGMTFTVEPILSQSAKGVVILEDGWTAMSLDEARAAQFEHTVLITEHGHEILTAYTE